jgi:hypothetical protein
MIFDQKKNAFRLVPINRHLYFEKQKTALPPPKPVVAAPTVNGGIPARRIAVAPRKKAKDILKNFKSLINKQKTQYFSGSKAPTADQAKRGRKKKMEGDNDPPAKKQGGGYDSALEYSDGNAEYDDAVKDNHLDDDSGGENVEDKDLIESHDSPSENDIDQSESDAKSKTSKVTQP